jgi:heat shock protein HtpX
MFWNQIKTTFLLASLSGLLLLIGYWLGGYNGIFIAFILSMFINFVMYFYSDKLVLKMYGAKPLDQEQYEHVYEIVSELTQEMKIPMPKLWYIPTEMANAFATGRNPQHASVAVTKGILDILDVHELRGVLAHELSHVKNRDILIATIAATMATAIGYLASMLRWSIILGGRSNGNGNDRSNGFGAIFAAILMPIAALLIQLAISRSREYLADETGAKASHDPLALASALEKLHDRSKKQKIKPSSPAQVSSASLFIVYPFSKEGLVSLFATHPPMSKRVERLRKMNP